MYEPIRRGAGRLGALAAVVTVLAGAAACSSGGGSSSAGTAASGSGTVKISVGTNPGNQDGSPFFAAMQEGYFKQAGLDVSYTSISGGDASISAALTNGSINVALGAATEWFSDIAKQTIQGKVVGEFTDKNYDVLGASGVTSVSQLKGKVIGISSIGAGDQIYLEAVLAKYGISPTDVTWLALGGPATRLSAMDAGKVAAIEMPLTTVPAANDSQVILKASASPVSFVSNAIFASQSFISSDTPALKKFLTAIGKGAAYLRSNPSSLAACELSGGTAAACKSSDAISLDPSVSDKYTWSGTTALDVTAVRTMLKAVAQVVPQASSLTLPDVIDTSIAGTNP